MDLKEKPESENRHPWELARFEVVKFLVDHQINNYGGKNILDIGCGDLFFLERFSEGKKDTTFFGVDTAFDDDFIQSNNHTSVKAYKSLDHIPDKENLRFDVVFLMDVIEHIEDDVSFLEDLVNRPFIDHNTLFVITVPAFKNLFTSFDTFLGHFRRYINASLEGITTQVGLTTLRKGYFFFSLLFPRYLRVIKEKRIGSKTIQGTGLTSWNQNRIITQILKHVLLLDFRIHILLKKAGINTPGLSNYLLCKKHVS